MTFISEILPKGPTSVRLKLACGHVQTQQDIGYRVGDRIVCPKCDQWIAANDPNHFASAEVSDAR